LCSLSFAELDQQTFFRYCIQNAQRGVLDGVCRGICARMQFFF
jgi:hypothetical protein